MYNTHRSGGGSRSGRCRIGRAHLSSHFYSCLALVGGAILLLGAASGGGASGVESQFVEAVETATEAGDLEVLVITTSPEPPVFSAFPLREPDRLVMDFRDYVWQPGLTAHLESSHSQVSGVRVGQFSKEPPVTRVVFDLMVPASELKYRPDRASGHGELSIRVAPPSGDEAAEPQGPSTGEEPITKPPPAGAAGAASAAAGGAAAPAGQGTGESGPQARPPASPGSTVASAGPTAPEGPKPGAQAASGQAGRASAQPPGAGPAATGPAGPPPPQQAGVTSWKGYLPVVLGAVALIIVLAGLAFWLRKRVGKRSAAPARAKATDPAAAEAIPVPDIAEQAPSQAAAPAAEPDGAAIRCRIVDGYLVLAPEGGSAALSTLAGEGARKAKVEGSISLTPVEEEEEEGGVQLPAEEEPVVAEASVAGERGDAEVVAEDDFVSAEALAAGEGMVDEPALEDPDDLPSRARALVESLVEEDEDERKRAAEGLCGLAETGHADVLAPYLQSEDPRVRLVIAGVLGEAGASAFAGPLAEVADDPDPSVRATVLYAFSQLGEAGSEYAREIRKRLSDEEASVRARAVEALAAVAPDDEEAAAHAVELTADPEFSVREAATSAALIFARHGAVRTTRP